LLSGNLVVTVTSPEMPRHQRQVARLTVSVTGVENRSCCGRE
jgi:hypothetical protein